ncbi:MAG: hypothetical protein PHU21_06390 [Elusimicrobia bacterium]|nr:hypothetical protein [Elusimicrobiota bacterium]
MLRTAFAAVFACLPSWTLALDQGLPELPSLSSITEKVFAQSESLRVDMEVYGYFEGTRYDIRDTFNKIDLEASRESSGKDFRFSGTVDGRYLTGRVEAQNDGSWRIWGGGLSVDLRPRGASGYEITGFVDEAEGSRHIDIDLRPSGAPGSFSVWESGMSIDVRKFGTTADCSGDIRTDRFGRKSLAVLGVFIAVLESELDRPAPAPAQPK